MARRARPGEVGFQEAKAAVSESVDVVEVAIPLGEVPAGANSRPLRIDIFLTREQSDACRRAMRGLRASKEVCKTLVGRTRLVDSKEDVVRWLLEQF